MRKVDHETKPAETPDGAERDSAPMPPSQADQYESLFKHMTQGVLRRDSTGAITGANKAAERMVGLSVDQMRGEFSGDPQWQYLREDGSHCPIEEHPARQAQRIGQSISNFVLGIQHKERDEHRWLLVNAIPEFNDGGESPSCVFTIFDDITDHKRAIDALRARESSYRTLVESGPNLTWITDADGVMEYVNQRWIDYTGRDLAATQKLGWLDIAMMEDARDGVAIWRDAEATGRPHEVEYQLRRYDGENRWFLARGIPLMGNDGRITGWFGTCTDIHDQKRAEQTQGFLSDLGETMHWASDPDEVLWETVQALGEFLQADRCLYAEIDGGQDEITVHRDYCRGVASIAGTYSYANFDVARELLQGHTVSICDTRDDPRSADQYASTYLPFSIRSGVAVPIISQGRQIALLSAQQAGEPRTWLPDEINLIETVADRTRLAMENARLQRALRLSAIREREILRDVLASVTDGRLILCAAPNQLPRPLTPASSDIGLSLSGGLRALRMAASAAACGAGLPEHRIHDLITAVGEAGLNAVVHVGKGVGRVYVDKDAGKVQVRVTDKGHGISLENLPSATLRKGFTTAGTLGHGMKMMLQTADITYLLTGSNGTTVVIEQGRMEHDEVW